MSEPLRLTETEKAERDIPDELGEALAASGLLDARRIARGRWRLHADRRFVGSARFGETELTIAPKVPIDRVMFMLGYVQNTSTWRWQDLVGVTEHDQLFAAVGHAFCRASERALRAGVLQGYREVEETATTLRGRIRVGEQLRRRHGLTVPLEIRYDDMTLDIVENRLLRAGAERLLGLPRTSQELRSRLRVLLDRLPGVARLRHPERPPAWPRTRWNARYHAALDLAGLILRGGSYELDGGTSMRVDGVLFDMARVFEDFVTVALGEELVRRGGTVRTQCHDHLDVAKQVSMYTDLVWYRGGPGGERIPLAVADAKYRAVKERAPAGHLYQMLGYCTVLGLKTAHLIYAGGPTGLVTHRIQGAPSIEVMQHVLELDRSPEEMVAQIARIAEIIVAGAPADEMGSLPAIVSGAP